MLARAVARTLRMSPRKARLVADQIRGQSVPDAVRLLNLSAKRAARPIGKLLRSAVANAEQKDPGVDTDELRVATITVDRGAMLKRWRPRAYGRATQILHRTCHITIELAAGAGKGRG